MVGEWEVHSTLRFDDGDAAVDLVTTEASDPNDSEEWICLNDAD